MAKINKVKFFGTLGVFFYYILSLPFIRSALFGEKGKILDAFDGQVSNGGDVVQFVGQSVLVIPYALNNYIFAPFDFNNMNVLVLLLMTPIVYRYFCFSRGFVSFVLLLFLFFPAPLLFLSTFTKETILVVCLFFSYGYYKELSIRNNFIYFTAYAITMRPYLFWVPLVIKFRKISGAVFGVFFIFLILLQFDLTSEIIFRIFNRRLVETLYDANSQIVQSVVVREPFDILLMSLEVLPQVFLPILFGFGLKSIIFQIYIFLLVALSIVRRNSYSNIVLILMVMYAILDPDLGAYFRHLSSFFIIFPMVIGMDKLMVKK